MKAFWREKNFRKRLVIMLLANLVMGAGIALFKVSLTGNDPSTALVIAIGDKIGVDFSIVLIVMNSLYFLTELIFERSLIGLGTFVNWFLIGPVASFCEKLIVGALGSPRLLLAKLGVMAVGVLVLSCSCAFYQTANMGISPYDSLSIMLSHKTPVPYFWCRILTDSLCVAAAFFLGGLLGLGTLVCALGLGPFITFFTKYAAKKVLPDE